MVIMDNRTLNHLAERLAPRIAERLLRRPAPGDVGADPEELLTEAQAAALLGMRPATLCVWRCRGYGPAFLRIGRKRRPSIRYKRGVILAYRDGGATDPEKRS